ncbi:nitroreductase [Mycolicibacterium novocastrense]|uniref:nitroreductase family deazaflavin-dependent oxidoreductase n=1 Tax=Mycolicibacterium novocastrense TaxID=59813 RepID=UPI0007463A6B|nr:nitroreductase family deazaflavin-dependent oxidoreductase [Mycolicibacterium novocastrense]KUH68901.1 nitroreductase [Mycolicibacterium novocastrense]KUH71114.1 nitroreductase [Mycolicibacterium novocastrense]KUH72216.1 nitroreductase [Mycolicibacterium novocastrense]KUH72292.1 nitroreductase [Mycolicibacterium novocastrense]
MCALLNLVHRVSDVLVGAGTKALRSRRLMRAPIGLYRVRLGFIFGSRILLLEHIGRKSGQTRQVVLEVLDRTDPEAYIVASGFGTRAQWYKNVQADPRVKVSVGTRLSRPAIARPLSTDEADAALRRYVDRHRRAWETMKPVLESTLGAPITTENTALPMVELRLTDH